MKQPLQQNNDRLHGVSGRCTKPPYVILLMDDEESILDSYGQLLVMKGFDVYTACNGDQAIDMYKQALSSDRRVDVAIIDLTIPEGMGGIETVARIKEIDPDIRAIATTGHFQDCLTDEYKKNGFVGILPKPYLLRELLEAIDRVIMMEEYYPC
jgi:two-component system, cell cycle sensor histidine kinase and response regulator CckA